MFFINRSSKDEEVDLAILLKNDKIIFLVIKLITITIKEIEAVIAKAANPFETRALKPLEVKKVIQKVKKQNYKKQDLRKYKKGISTLKRQLKNYKD